MTVELEQKYFLSTVLTRLYCYSEYVVLRLLKHETGWNNYGRTLSIFRDGNETAAPIMKLVIFVTRWDSYLKWNLVWQCYCPVFCVQGVVWRLRGQKKIQCLQWNSFDKDKNAWISARPVGDPSSYTARPGFKNKLSGFT